MVVDTSALLAILLDEPEREAFSRTLGETETRWLSAANFVEASIVIEGRHGAEGTRELDRLIESLGIEIVAVDTTQAHRARDAFSRFGKGIHPAGLNFGDCFAYALASTRGEQLLFKGTDFGQTDLPSGPEL